MWSLGCRCVGFRGSGFRVFRVLDLTDLRFLRLSPQIHTAWHLAHDVGFQAVQKTVSRCK